MHCVTVFCRCSKVLNAANNDVSLFFGWVYTINSLQENCMTTSESKGRFFLQNETIRIDSHNESNRIDSNRELECSSGDATGARQQSWCGPATASQLQPHAAAAAAAVGRRKTREWKTQDCKTRETSCTIRYDTIRDAILTCARKPTWVSLIYSTVYG